MLATHLKRLFARNIRKPQIPQIATPKPQLTQADRESLLSVERFKLREELKAIESCTEIVDCFALAEHAPKMHRDSRLLLLKRIQYVLRAKGGD